MPLDPRMGKILELIGFDHFGELKSRSVSEAIRLLRSGGVVAPAQLAARSEDRFLQSPAGSIPLRISWPPGEGPFPILVNYHGGGWVTGSIAGDDLRCQRLTCAAQCITISVGYRLAPEHPYPAGLEDCWSALTWAYHHASEISGDAARIAVSGASAGANLAAAICVRARDEGVQFPIFQILFYPVLDGTTRGGDVDGGPYYLSREAMDWYWDRYTGIGANREDPYLSPLLAPALSGVAPALIITAELDPLAAEGRAYGSALAAAGVAVEQQELPGVVHGFISFGPDLPQTLDALSLASNALERVFSS